MRLFIAIGIPKQIKEALQKCSNELQQVIKQNDLAKCNFVDVNNMHLTLKFLGEVNEQKLNDIKDALYEIDFESFNAQLSNVGIFPNENHVRVVWVGIKDGKHILKLQKDIEEKMDAIGFEKDNKEFHPHLTLARVKFVKDKSRFTELLKKIEVDNVEFNVNGFSLIQSTLTPEGPVYKVLAIYS